MISSSWAGGVYGALTSLSLGVVQLTGAASANLDAAQLASLASDAKRQAKAIPGYSLHVIQAA